MAAPSKIAEAKRSPDRVVRTEVMAETMRLRKAASGACTFADLCAAGFTEAEIEAYRDDARAILAGIPLAPIHVPAGRLEGLALVRQAQAMRPAWVAPQVGHAPGT